MIMSNWPGKGPPAAEDEKTRLDLVADELMAAQNAVLNLETNLEVLVEALVGAPQAVEEEVKAKQEEGGLLGTVSAVSNDIMMSVSRMTDKIASLR